MSSPVRQILWSRNGHESHQNTKVNGGNTTFRFFTDNPGAWFLHWSVSFSHIPIPDSLIFLSHIDWHLEAGLAVVFGESPADNIRGPQSQIQTPDWKALCPMYNDLEPEFQ